MLIVNVLALLDPARAVHERARHDRGDRPGGRCREPGRERRLDRGPREHRLEVRRLRDDDDRLRAAEVDRDEALEHARGDLDLGQGGRVHRDRQGAVGLLDPPRGADLLPRGDLRAAVEVVEGRGGERADGRGREQHEQDRRGRAALACPARGEHRRRGRGRRRPSQATPASGIGYSRTTRIPAAIPTSAGTAAISGSTPEPSVASRDRRDAAIAEQQRAADRRPRR